MKTILLMLTKMDSTAFGRLSFLLSRLSLSRGDTVLVHLNSNIGQRWSKGGALNFVHSFYGAISWLKLPAAFRILIRPLIALPCAEYVEDLMRRVDCVFVDCAPSEGVQLLPSCDSCVVQPTLSFIDMSKVEQLPNKFQPAASHHHFADSSADQRCSLDLAQSEHYNHVAIGGTFDRLHNGHEMMLTSAALLGRRLTVGVTSAQMLKHKCLQCLIEPLEQRMEGVRNFLSTINSEQPLEIVPIDDVYGPTLTNTNIDCLVVSEDSVDGALMINKGRVDLSMPELKVVKIALLQSASAGSVLSSTCVRREILGELIKAPKDCSDVRPYVIGLTGGIASGKSTIATYLSLWGAHVIDCDRVGHKAYEPGTKAYRSLIDTFGMDIVNNCQGGKINRAVLGKIVFSNQEKMQKLNNIVWPEIANLVQQELFALSTAKRVVVVEAAVLLDAGWQDFVHEVWLTYVPTEEAIERVLRRTNCSHEDAESRVNAQRLNDSQRVEKANVVFCSAWHPDYTRGQVAKAWRNLLARIAL